MKSTIQRAWIPWICVIHLSIPSEKSPFNHRKNHRSAPSPHPPVHPIVVVAGQELTIQGGDLGQMSQDLRDFRSFGDFFSSIFWDSVISRWGSSNKNGGNGMGFFSWYHDSNDDSNDILGEKNDPKKGDFIFFKHVFLASTKGSYKTRDFSQGFCDDLMKWVVNSWLNII